MFDHHIRVYSKLMLGADIVVGLLSLFSAYWVRSLVPHVPLNLDFLFNPELLPFRDYFLFFLAYLPIWVLLLVTTQDYPDIARHPIGRQVSAVLRLTLVSGIVMGFLTYTFKLEISRPIFFLFLGLSTALLLANRLLLNAVLRSRNISRHSQVNLLIVGTSPRALQLGKQLEQMQRWGFHVLGYLQLTEATRDNPAVRVVGSLKDLPKILLADWGVDEIIFVGSDLTDMAAFDEMIRFCEELGVRTRVAADFFPTSISKVSLDSLDGLPLITFSAVPDHSVALVAKRAVDFIVAAGALLAFSPLMLLVALAVKLTSPGPVLYRQTRCGLYGRKFPLVKFRTMIEGAEDKLWEIRHLNEMSGPVFKMRNDPRVTPLGRFLRKFSIDELPQFWNVIRGEMSVVGPRAPLPEEVIAYSFRQRRRLSVKPGITCLWQVSGRSEIDFHRWMDMDLEYIDNWSIWLDFLIMLRTIPAVFTGRGAR